MSKKPRTWWLNATWSGDKHFPCDPDTNFYRKTAGNCRINDDDEIVKVIELSAYDALHDLYLGSMAELNRLKMTLEFYENSDNWRNFATEMLADAGGRARKALKGGE